MLKNEHRIYSYISVWQQDASNFYCWIWIRIHIINLTPYFLTQQHITIPQMTEELGVKVSPMSDRLVAYCWSLSPYFNDPSQTNPGLLRLKVMELLFNVMDCSKNIFRQMLQLRQPVKADVHRIVEENYTSPVSLEELAYLSGRSLSSFQTWLPEHLWGDSSQVDSREAIVKSPSDAPIVTNVRCRCSLQSWFREPHSFQPYLQATVWCATITTKHVAYTELFLHMWESFCHLYFT